MHFGMILILSDGKQQPLVASYLCHPEEPQWLATCVVIIYNELIESCVNLPSIVG